jgi:hypothetical protein
MDANDGSSRPAVREAVDLLASNYLAEVTANPGMDQDQYFLSLRDLIVSRAQTVRLVDENGPMGGGGAGEA